MTGPAQAVARTGVCDQIVAAGAAPRPALSLILPVMARVLGAGIVEVLRSSLSASGPDLTVDPPIVAADRPWIMTKNDNKELYMLNLSHMLRHPLLHTMACRFRR